MRVVSYECDVRGCDADAPAEEQGLPLGWSSVQLVTRSTDGSLLRGHAELCPKDAKEIADGCDVRWQRLTGEDSEPPSFEAQ